MARKALIGHLGDVDIRLLRIFRAVVKSGGLAAAELELNIGRSTISKHISDLELRLGMTLCNRGPGGFSLTGEGEQVLAAIEQLLVAISTFRDDVAEVHEKLTGRLKIALFDQTVTNPAAKLSHAFRRFEQHAPDVELDVAIEPTNVIEVGIFDGQFDIGIIPIHRKSTGLNYARAIFRADVSVLRALGIHCIHRPARQDYRRPDPQMQVCGVWDFIPRISWLATR